MPIHFIFFNITMEDKFEIPEWYKIMVTESDARLERQMKESRAEWEKRNAETDKKFAETRALIESNAVRMKALQEELGGVGRSNGQIAEDTIYDALEKDMTFAGKKFQAIDRNWSRKETAIKLQAEFDIVLINDDTLALIETKYKVRDKDVNKLVDTTKNNFKILFPQYDKYKIILGVGGMTFDKEAIDVANNNGVGLIKIVGDKVEFQTENIKQY